MRQLLAAAAALFAVTVPAVAAPTGCPGHFPSGSAPDILRPVLAERSKELCYTGFAVLHSGLTRTPLWSAEHVTRDHVLSARNLPRVDSFKADNSIPPADRAELSDFVRSGYDRGHMAPNGDMWDERSQSESFFLTNMVPQAPENNRGIWSAIESAVRDLAVREGDVYVVTGPVFEGDTVSSINGRVLVPTHIYKAVFVPSRGQAAVYLTANAPGNSWKTLSIDELSKITGFDVFPAISKEAKAAPMRLPEPHDRSEYTSAPPPRKPAWGGLLRGLLR